MPHEKVTCKCPCAKRLSLKVAQSHFRKYAATLLRPLQSQPTTANTKHHCPNIDTTPSQDGYVATGSSHTSQEETSNNTLAHTSISGEPSRPTLPQVASGQNELNPSNQSHEGSVSGESSDTGGDLDGGWDQFPLYCDGVLEEEEEDTFDELWQAQALEAGM